MNSIFKKTTHYSLILIVLAYIFYEELVWERFAKPIVRYIQSLNLLKTLDKYLQNVNGGLILLIFVSLFVLVELQGFYAAALLFKGKVILWVLIYAGKIPVAAFTFWLFKVTKPKLMAFAWFKKSYEIIIETIDWLKSTDIYKNIKIKSAEIKSYVKKNYFREGDTIKVKIRRIYRRLKIRFDAYLKK